MYDVVWPRGRKVAVTTRLAQRLDTLAGRTVAELWDWLFRGDEIFRALEQELARRCPGIRFVRYDEFGSTHGGREAAVLAALPEKLAQHGCHAVLSGMGC